MVIPSEKMLNLTRRGNAVLPVAQLSGGVRQLHLGEKKASRRSKPEGFPGLCFRPRKYYCAVNIMNGASRFSRARASSSAIDFFLFSVEKFRARRSGARKLCFAPTG